MGLTSKLFSRVYPNSFRMICTQLFIVFVPRKLPGMNLNQGQTTTGHALSKAAICVDVEQKSFTVIFIDQVTYTIFLHISKISHLLPYQEAQNQSCATEFLARCVFGCSSNLFTQEISFIKHNKSTTKRHP